MACTTVKIAEYYPYEISRSLPSGKNAPLLANCIPIDQEQPIAEIVIKLFSNQFTHEAQCRELIAALIAKEMILLVAEPVLVIIDDTNLPIFGSELIARATIAKGINYGCKWAGDGYNEFVLPIDLKDSLLIKALDIFLLDIAWVHVDRRLEKQNLKTYGEQIIIFDHELAFGFISYFSWEKLPWQATTMPDWISQHVFYSALKNSVNKPKNQQIVSQQIDTFVSRLNVIDNDFWHQVRTLIPQDWLINEIPIQFEGIKAHFKTLNQDKSILSDYFKTLLL
jgi:hypothetical protein